MDDRSPGQYLHALKEVSIDPSSPLGSIIRIHVSQPSSFTVRQRRNRHILRVHHVFDSPDAFGRHYLATATSLYHSLSTRYPRSYLWRIVEDQKVLELRATDLDRGADEGKDAAYTIQLQFGGRLRNGGVALTDSQDSNSITIYALTKSNELYTIALPTTFFHNLKSSEQDVSTWCKIAQPAAFSISAPHMLIAVNPTQLVVALADGRLLFLSKTQAMSGSRWTESIYGEGNWTSSLRGLVKWQGNNTIQYDDNVLELSTAVSLALSSDGGHALVVTLDHRLRVWSVKTGSIVYSGDLLGMDVDQSELGRFSLDPHISSYLRMTRLAGAPRGFNSCAVTFSTHNGGTFKFWGIRDLEAGSSGVKDMFPDSVLNQPDPSAGNNDGSIWKVVDFQVEAISEDADLVMWILLQNGRQNAVCKLKTHLLKLPESWNTGWVSSAPLAADKSESTPLSISPGNIDEEWCNHILRPTGPPEAVIESALLMYRSNRELDAGDQKAPLRQRVISAIRSQADKFVAYGDEQSRTEVTIQEWSNLWQYVCDFQHLGESAVALSIDHRTRIPWVSTLRGCSIFRTLTSLEQISNNLPDVLSQNTEDVIMASVENDTGGEPKLPSELCVVLEAAATLRSSFNLELQRNIALALSKELWEEPKAKMPARLEEFSKRCGFENLLHNEQLDDLDSNLEAIDGLQNLDSDSFFSIFDRLSHIFDDERPSDLVYTIFGIRTLIGAGKEMIYGRESILMDLLACTVVASSEVDQTETTMQYFDGPQIFERLLELLRQAQVMRWLVDHTDADKPRMTPHKRQSSSTSEPALDWKPTLLETVFARTLVPHDADTATGSAAFTHGVQDLLQWVLGGTDKPTLADVTTRIQCHLLKRENMTLATDFLRFQSTTPWATYVKGRYYLLNGQTDEAVQCFQNAGPKLAKPPSKNQQQAFRDLLSAIEASHFGHGLPNYYSHIIAVLMGSKPPCPAEAAQFASLALEKLPNQDHSEERDSLLESLFSASLQTHDFSSAHSALLQHSSPQTLLPDFIKALLAHPSATPQLLTLFWPEPLHHHVDAVLTASSSPKLLASWRLHLNDFRGAAAALLPSLTALRKQPRKTAKEDRALETEYLTIINLLECAGKANAWVLTGGEDGEKGTTGKRGVGKPAGRQARKVVTLADLRREYQEESDRRDMLERGGYAFGADEDGDQLVTNGHTSNGAADAMEIS